MESTLHFIAEPINCNGELRSRITVKHSNNIIAMDSIKLDSQISRSRFAKNIAGKTNQPQDEIESELLNLAGQQQSQVETASESKPTRQEVNYDSPYRATEHGIIWIRLVNDAEIPVPLTNFSARIEADVLYDDGVECSHTFEIEASLDGKTKSFRVPVIKFSSMNWAIENLGARAMIYPGSAIKDHARAAIQLLSDNVLNRHVYTHLGWRKIGKDWFFLHSGGAIGPLGPVLEVVTELEGNLKYYTLPDPPSEDNLKSAILTSLKILDLVPNDITMPLFCSKWRVVLGQCHFACHLAGHTGTGKTELIALIQQFFGAEMNAKNLPGSWSSTANSLEGLAFKAKDVILTVDDFAPNGSSYDIQRYHRDADRLLRAQGNRSSRQRMRSDATLRPVKPPRGLILSTGEDIPRGQSIRARMLVLELGPNDMDWEKLTQCQQDASSGIYVQVMAGYVKWLAPQMEDVQKRLPQQISEWRTKATRSQQHRRIPDIVANLQVGFEYFLKFALQAHAIDQNQKERLGQRCWAALEQVASNQTDHQSACDPVLRFFELLSSAIASGHAHIANINGAEPAVPESMGWRKKTTGTGNYQRTEWQPQGDRVGWTEQNKLYLEPEASYRIAQAMAGTNNDNIPVMARTLRKRMDERGILLVKEPNRLTVRVILERTRKRVLCVSVDSLMSQKVDQLDQADHDYLDENKDSGPLPGSTSGPDTSESGPESGH